MERKEVEKIAKEKYPIGTRVDSAGGNSNEEVNTHNLYWLGSHLRCHDNLSLYDETHEKWAKILELPKPKVIDTYPIF